MNFSDYSASAICDCIDKLDRSVQNNQDEWERLPQSLREAIENVKSELRYNVISTLDIHTLKAICVMRGIRATGTKDEIIYRITNESLAWTWNPPDIDNDENYSPLEALSVQELREMCRDCNVPVSGNKSNLIHRLHSRSVPTRSFHNVSLEVYLQRLTLSELKEICRSQQIQVSGNKATIVQRIMEKCPNLYRSSSVSPSSSPPQDSKCIVCVDETPVYIYPCSHFAYCESCFRLGENSDYINACPICRNPGLPHNINE